MPRARKYETNAERQAAYRARKKKARQVRLPSEPGAGTAPSAGSDAQDVQESGPTVIDRFFSRER